MGYMASGDRYTSDPPVWISGFKKKKKTHMDACWISSSRDGAQQCVLSKGPQGIPTACVELETSVPPFVPWLASEPLCSINICSLRDPEIKIFLFRAADMIFSLNLGWFLFYPKSGCSTIKTWLWSRWLMTLRKADHEGKRQIFGS